MTAPAALAGPAGGGPLLPSDGGEALAWAALAAVWTAANYLHRLDPLGAEAHRALAGRRLAVWRRRVLARAAAGAVAVYLLAAGAGPATGAALAALFLLEAAALPLVRAEWARRPGRAGWRELRAEWELAAGTAFLLPAAVLVGWRDVSLGPAARDLGLAPGRAAVVLVFLSAGVFLLRGGTHVVRGALEKSDTLPGGGGNAGAGAEDVRHGVTIGNLERLVVFGLAALGAYGALGLVVAAKGLVRALEWRDRELLEYFLVGTLASVALALFVGVGVGALAAAWW